LGDLQNMSEEKNTKRYTSNKITLLTIIIYTAYLEVAKVTLQTQYVNGKLMCQTNYCIVYFTLYISQLTHTG
jgi:hypothetical protein